MLAAADALAAEIHLERPQAAGHSAVHAFLVILCNAP